HALAAPFSLVGCFFVLVPRLVALALSAVLSVAPGLLLLLNVLAQQTVEFPQCPEGGTQVGIAAGLRRRLLLCLVAVVVCLGLVVGVPGNGEEARVQVAVVRRAVKSAFRTSVCLALMSFVPTCTIMVLTLV